VEETRGREAAEEKLEAAGEREGEKRKGDAPQVPKASHEIRGYKKPSETDPSALGKILIA